MDETMILGSAGSSTVLSPPQRRWGFCKPVTRINALMISQSPNMTRVAPTVPTSKDMCLHYERWIGATTAKDSFKANMNCMGGRAALYLPIGPWMCAGSGHSTGIQMELTLGLAFTHLHIDQNQTSRSNEPQIWDVSLCATYHHPDTCRS